MIELNWIKQKRKQMGLTQAALAQKARVSFQTVQLLESGRCNPSLLVLESVSSALGVSIEFVSQKADWAILSKLGVAIMDIDPSLKIIPRWTLLEKHLTLAASEKLDDRKKKSIQALLLALRNHFPFYYQSLSKTVQKIFPTQVTGEIIKLSRISKEKLAEYL